jgi:2-oxoglutarate dehydrogenase complex dehydrogenase (E1) component-like enzyme
VCFSSYAQKMHEAWRKEPSSVHRDWDLYFKNGSQLLVENKSPELDPKQMDKIQDLAISTHLLIRYYKHRGHELAVLDPLSTQLKYLDLKNF